MQHSNTLRIGAVLLAALALVPVMAGETGKAAASAERAAQLIQVADPTQEQIKEYFHLLLDAIAEVAPEAGVPAGFTEKIADARRRMSEVSLLDGNAIELLHQCYAGVHGGARFKMPETVRAPADAADYVRGRLVSVRGLLKEKKTEEAVRRMLEAVLAVTTPVEAEM